MKPQRPLVRVRVLNTEGKFLERANVTAASSTHERFRLHHDPHHNVFTDPGLRPGVYSLEVHAEGLESVTREIEVTEQGACEVFVLGRAGLPSYYRGKVRVPFDHPNMYAIALKRRFVDDTFERLTSQQGVSLANFRPQAVEVSDEVRRQGVQVFTVAPGTGGAFERLARAQSFVRAAGAVVRLTRRSVSFLTNEILLEVKPDQQIPDVGRSSELNRRPYRNLSNWWTLEASEPYDSMQLIDLCGQLAGHPAVAWAEPNLFSTVITHTVPTAAPALDQALWNANQPHHKIIDTLGAWELSTGRGIVIAIVDGGCDITHPDLAGKIIDRYNFSANPTEGEDPRSLTADPHGTCCAGIAAAAANTDSNYSGVAPDAELIVLERFADTDPRFADIFLWCAGLPTQRTDLPPGPAKPINVISCSWDLDHVALSASMKLAFDTLASEGRVVVFSAGNLVEADFSTQAYGALAAYEKNIAVGSSLLGEPNHVALDSGWGIALDLLAPGGGQGDTVGETKTTVPPPDTYGPFGHTSCACPQVAGLVALMFAVNSGLSSAQVLELLKQTADKIGDVEYNESGFNPLYGFGRVSASKAVSAASKA